MSPTNDLPTNELGFGFICGSTNHTLAKRFLHKNPTINIHNNHEFPFRYACRSNCLETAQWLYFIATQKIRVNMYNNEAFRKACKYNWTPIINWLLSLNRDVHLGTSTQSGFITACKHNHLGLAQRLYATYKSTSKQVTTAFCNACYNNSLEVVTWLAETHPHFVEEMRHYEAFQELIEHNCFRIVRWLHTKTGHAVNLQDRDYLFIFACHEDYVEIARWLCELYGNYRVEVANKIITKFEISI
jgi:hypothetical protein